MTPLDPNGGGPSLLESCAPSKRCQTIEEEIANSVSHGLGLAAVLAGIPFLLVQAAHQNDARLVVGTSVFSVTLVLMYLASTLYHALPRGKAKQIFRLIEHSAIFLLIAGTYTPFTLSVLRGAWGWALFGIVWSLAAAGILLKLFGGVRHPVLSTFLYIAMGWVVLIALRPMWQGLPHIAFYLVLAGGLAYTIGVGFYAASRLRYCHFVWHLFVLAGSLCHYFAVLDIKGVR